MNTLFLKWFLNDNYCTIIYVIAIVYMSTFCCWDDVYCVIYKAYKVYNNKATKYAKCTTTKQRSMQSVQQQSIKNALCTVVMRIYHISTP